MLVGAFILKGKCYYQEDVTNQMRIHTITLFDLTKITTSMTQYQITNQKLFKSVNFWNISTTHMMMNLTQTDSYNETWVHYTDPE